MARTMSDLLERAARALAVEATGGSLDETRNALDGTLSELDAERAAHGETKAALYAEQSANAHMRSVVDNDTTELTALKARLALAEAVCEAADRGDWNEAEADELLAAWRAGK